MAGDNGRDRRAVPLSRVVAGVPAMTPFVGPETIERRLGHTFKARIGANESAFGISPKARAALAAEIDRAAWYCDPEHFDLRSRLAERFGVKLENIVIGEGIDGLLGLLVRAYVNPGDPVVTSAGAYPTFNYHVTGYGGRLVFVPYTAGYCNDPDALADAAAQADARLLYLANPDNPTGSFLPRSVVERLLQSLPPRCLLLLDEAYAEFAPADELAPIDAGHPQIIRLRTFSKAHGMAGLRVGYGIAAPEVIETFEKIRLHFGVGRLSQVAAAASLEDPEFAAEVVARVAKARAEYAALARALGLATLPSHTNFVSFDLETGDRAGRMVSLLEERGVFVRRSAVAPLDRFVRISIGTPEERAILAEALTSSLRAL